MTKFLPNSDSIGENSELRSPISPDRKEFSLIMLTAIGEMQTTPLVVSIVPVQKKYSPGECSLPFHEPRTATELRASQT
jgi:hypothetical protein